MRVTERPAPVNAPEAATQLTDIGASPGAP